MERVKATVNAVVSKSATFYYLDLDREKDAEMVAEFEVYSFFIAFISIDKRKNIVMLIEFGQD